MKLENFNTSTEVRFVNDAAGQVLFLKLLWFRARNGSVILGIRVILVDNL